MASLPLSASVVETFLTKLEEGQSAPGTTISRVLVSNEILRRHGVATVGDDRETVLAWSLGIGNLQMPKRFFYGLTLQEVFKLARKDS